MFMRADQLTVIYLNSVVVHETSSVKVNIAITLT
jgi:hypothetical protein